MIRLIKLVVTLTLFLPWLLLSGFRKGNNRSREASAQDRDEQMESVG